MADTVVQYNRNMHAAMSPSARLVHTRQKFRPTTTRICTAATTAETWLTLPKKFRTSLAQPSLAAQLGKGSRLSSLMSVVRKQSCPPLPSWQPGRPKLRLPNSCQHWRILSSALLKTASVHDGCHERITHVLFRVSAKKKSFQKPTQFKKNIKAIGCSAASSQMRP